MDPTNTKPCIQGPRDVSASRALRYFLNFIIITPLTITSQTTCSAITRMTTSIHHTMMATKVGRRTIEAGILWYLQAAAASALRCTCLGGLWLVGRGENMGHLYYL